MKKEPKIYVGTYRKYAEGSLHGEWLTLSDYTSYAEFMEACRELHADEDDPEYMYQDYEDYPAQWYCEHHLDEDTFDKILEYAELGEDEQDAYDAYIDNVGDGEDISSVISRFICKVDEREDFGYYLADNYLVEIPEHLYNYIDFEKLADDYLQDYYYCDGYVFSAR